MTSSTFKKLGVQCLGIAAMVLFAIGTAHAGGEFKDSVEKVGNQAEALPQFIQFVCYVLGIGLTAKGILAGKKYSENPSGASSGLLGVIGPLAVGGLLIALPSVADMAIKSTLSSPNSTKTFGSNGTFGGTIQ